MAFSTCKVSLPRVPYTVPFVKLSRVKVFRLFTHPEQYPKLFHVYSKFETITWNWYFSWPVLRDKRWRTVLSSFIQEPLVVCFMTFIGPCMNSISSRNPSQNQEGSCRNLTTAVREQYVHNRRKFITRNKMVHDILLSKLWILPQMVFLLSK